MTSRSVLSRTVALALVLGAAAAVVSAQGDSVGSPALLGLVLAGSMSVGGIAPRGLWWLGGLVGAGVAVGQFIAGSPAGAAAVAPLGAGIFAAPWVGLVAPVLVAVAGAGLGAAWQRSTGYGPGS